MIVLILIAAPLTLSLDEAMRRAERVAPSVVMSLRLVGEARAQRVGAGVPLPNNPRIYGEARPAITGAWDLGFAVNIDSTFEVFGAPFARIEAAQAIGRASQANADMVRFTARIDAFQAYIDARAAELSVEAADDAIAAAIRTREASATRVKAGAGSDIDVLTSAVEEAEFRATLSQATAELEVARAELRQLLDLEPGTELALTTELKELPQVPPLSESMLGERPEIVALSTRIDALNAQEKRLRAEARPKIGLFLGVDAAPVSGWFGQAGLGIELPLAQRNQGPLALVAAERETVQANLALEMRRLLREYDTRTRILKTRAEALKHLDETGIPAARRNVELVETGWRAGRFDIFRLTSAARSLNQLRFNRVSVLRAVWAERIALERIVGATQ